MAGNPHVGTRLVDHPMQDHCTQADYLLVHIESEACVGTAVSKKNSLLSLFQVFLCLQLVDAITTLLVLHTGGQELNPILRGFMHLGPISGLIAGKLTVLGVGAFVVWCQRPRVLVLANRFYIALAVWNTVILVTLQTQHA